MSRRSRAVVINRIVLNEVPIKGVDEMELALLAKEVTERMADIEKEITIVDTLKVALLAALSFAADKYLKQQNEDMVSNRCETLIRNLQETVE